MSAPNLLLSLLVGGIVALFGSLYVRLPAKSQERWKVPVFVTCGFLFAVGVGIMAVGVLGGFD